MTSSSAIGLRRTPWLEAQSLSTKGEEKKMRDDLTKPMAKSIMKFVKHVQNHFGSGYIFQEENHLHQDNLDREMEEINDDNDEYK